MGRERDELKKAEEGKKRAVLTAAISIIGVAYKIGTDIISNSKRNELAIEKNGIEGKLFKSKEDKLRLREIEEYLNKK